MKWAGSCALVEEGLELVVGEDLSKVCRGVVCREEEDYPHYDGGIFFLYFPFLASESFVASTLSKRNW